MLNDEGDAELDEDPGRSSPGFLVQFNVEASQIHPHALLLPSRDQSWARKKLFAGRRGAETAFIEQYATFSIHKTDVEGAFEGLSEQNHTEFSQLIANSSLPLPSLLVRHASSNSFR